MNLTRELSAIDVDPSVKYPKLVIPVNVPVILPAVGALPVPPRDE